MHPYQTTIGACCGPAPGRGLRPARHLSAWLLVGMSLTLSACGNRPADDYERICLAASTVELQRASCRCMAAEYAAVLTEEEYAAVVAMMEKAVASARSAGASEPLGAFVEPSPGDGEHVMSAFTKMEPLHRAGTCGYGRGLPDAEP